MTESSQGDSMEHTPIPEDYYTQERWHDSPLTDSEREAIRHALRDLLLRIKPESSHTSFDHPAVREIHLRREVNHPSLNIHVYLEHDYIEVDPIGDMIFDADGREISDTNNGHYLRDLGPTWEALEYDLLSEFVLMLDLPEHPSEFAKRLVGDGPARLFCTSCDPLSAEFTTFVDIPSHRIPTDEDAEKSLANQLEPLINGKKSSQFGR